MARVEVPLIGDLAILQGETYQALSLTFPGDLSTWTPRGQIRSKILEESGTLLAEFSFEASTYDADTDTTTVNPRLTPAQTASLRQTKWQGIGEYSKTGVYYYDIELENAGEVIKTKTAIVQVVGEVTGAGTPAPSTTEIFLTAQNNLSEITDPAAARENLGIVGDVKPDWNATPGSNEEILNKPDLSIYAETSAVNSALAGKENADPTILKESDINSTIQPFNAGTVIDSEYATVKQSAQSALQPAALEDTTLTGIPTAPTAPEGTNTTQIATTAFVLANAVGGVDNGVVINGVANFWQSTPPTQRIDASSLQDGDVWYKPTDNGFPGTAGFWQWNGALWVTTQVHAHESASFTSISTINSRLVENGDFASTGSVDLVGLPFLFNNLVLIDYLSLSVSGVNTISANFSASNSFELWPSLTSSNSARGFAVKVDALGIIDNGFVNSSVYASAHSVQAVIDVDSIANLFRPRLTVLNIVGSPAYSGSGNIGISFGIMLRGIHP